MVSSREEPLEARRDQLWKILKPVEGKAGSLSLPKRRVAVGQVTFAVYKNFEDIVEEEIQASDLTFESKLHAIAGLRLQKKDIL